MKTTIKNLKKGIVTLCSALVMTTGSFTQPNPDSYKNDEIDPMVRLEALMNGTEQSIRFVAPNADEAEAQERLNSLASLTEASIKYEAPSVDETNELSPETDRLNRLAELTESAVKYEAPSVDQIEVTPELERLDMLAAKIEMAAAFKAPDVNDVPEMENIRANSNEIMLADKSKK